MGERKKILVVDDNPSFAQLVQCAFEDNYDVTVATDGAAGIKTAAVLKPDIILTDVMMPNTSGIEMLRMLLGDADTRRIPVIVFTGTHFNNSVENLFKQEVNVKGFLSKTTPVDVIITTVENILSVKH
jgi:CheY-like chemotaxis protein